MLEQKLYFKDLSLAEQAELIINGMLGVHPDRIDGIGNFDFGLHFETETELLPERRGKLIELTEAYGCIFNACGNELPNQPCTVDALARSEKAAGRDELNTEQPEGTFKIMNIEAMPNGYRAMKQVFQGSVQRYEEQLHYLDMLLTFVQDHQFGEATGAIHALLEEMIAVKQSSIEEAIEGLRSSLTELERGGY